MDSHHDGDVQVCVCVGGGGQLSPCTPSLDPLHNTATLLITVNAPSTDEVWTSVWWYKQPFVFLLQPGDKGRERKWEER